jgi:hypothetical protein
MSEMSVQDELQAIAAEAGMATADSIKPKKGYAPSTGPDFKVPNTPTGRAFIKRLRQFSTKYKVVVRGRGPRALLPYPPRQYAASVALTKALRFAVYLK